MKICYLADARSVHTQRWVKSVAAAGHKVVVITFRPAEIEGVPVYTIKTPRFIKISPTAPFWSRFNYLFGKRQAKKIVDSFSPDILHAFWVTSYGFLSTRLDHPNYLVSVWGQDITKSPNNWLMRKIIQFNLSRAKKVFCTSKFLLNKTSVFIENANKLVHLPFGVDLDKFSPKHINHNQDKIIIGSTKSFEKVYGLEILIKAFSEIHMLHTNTELLLVGKGSELLALQNLVRHLEIEKVVTFQSPVNYINIPQILNKIDIFVMPSFSEAFGVAALEASAVGIPVIGSQVGGIPEVIEDGVTGILVPPGNVEALINALEKLVKSPELRYEYGNNGWKFVQKRYVWEDNVNELLAEYKNIIED
ncbi:MAG: glycosyltransferase [Candidatus Cloacimonetes bacterium]|nr:glycosyltransferase [Candidatus Cloacimonadota bacterium]